MLHWGLDALFFVSVWGGFGAFFYAGGRMIGGWIPRVLREGKRADCRWLVKGFQGVEMVTAKGDFFGFRGTKTVDVEVDSSV